jgi:ribose transport system substrate-binding protein
MKRRARVASMMISLAVLVTGCSSTGGSSAPDASAGSTGSAKAGTIDLNQKTKGPNGEVATPVKEVTELTAQQVAQIQPKHYKVAILNGGASTWFSSMESGARAEAKKLGMDVVLTTDANFDAAKQAAQVETAMARHPDVIITLPVDPVAAAQAFKPAVDAHVKLLFVDNGINGYTAGQQYVSIVTGDHFGMGRAAAELMSTALSDKGKIGYIFHDADFYVTNNRDRYFKAVIEKEHPNIKIVAQQGFTAESDTEGIASAMLTQHPDLDGIYVAWSAAATGVLAALRAAGNTHVKVVAHDLDATNDLEIAKGENLFGVAADRPYLEGQTMVRLAAKSLLGEKTPPFVIVDPVKESRDTITQAWHDSLDSEPPAEVKKALGK